MRFLLKQALTTVVYPWIDNSGRSVICAIGLISETIQSRITCETSNNRPYFSVSIYINNIIIILDSRKL